MASVDKRPNGKWRARWREYPGGPQKTKAFARKVDAERFLVGVEHSLLTGGYIDPAAGKITLGAYATTWATRQPWRGSTRVRQDGIVANHLTPQLGDRPLASVRPSEVQAFVMAMTRTLAPGTVKGVFGTLVSVYRSAVADRLVAHSPCDGVKLPSVAARRVEPLDVEAVNLLADAIGDGYRPLVILGAGAGLRIGEALGLEVRRIDFLRRQLSVTQQAATVKRVTRVAPPKTSASVRDVPLGAGVLAALAEHLERHPTAPGALIVADRAGGPIPQSRFGQHWSRTVARVGLPAGTRYHDLRHTFASALISAGCSVKAVQVALGHESAATTLNIYSHLWPSDTDRTRAAIDDFLRAEDSLRTAGALETDSRRSNGQTT